MIIAAQHFELKPQLGLVDNRQAFVEHERLLARLGVVPASGPKSRPVSRSSSAMRTW